MVFSRGLGLVALCATLSFAQVAAASQNGPAATLYKKMIEGTGTTAEYVDQKIAEAQAYVNEIKPSNVRVKTSVVCIIGDGTFVLFGANVGLCMTTLHKQAFFIVGGTGGFNRLRWRLSLLDGSLRPRVGGKVSLLYGWYENAEVVRSGTYSGTDVGASYGWIGASGRVWGSKNDNPVHTRLVLFGYSPGADLGINYQRVHIEDISPEITTFLNWL